MNFEAELALVEQETLTILAKTRFHGTPWLDGNPHRGLMEAWTRFGRNGWDQTDLAGLTVTRRWGNSVVRTTDRTVKSHNGFNLTIGTMVIRTGYMLTVTDHVDRLVLTDLPVDDETEIRVFGVRVSTDRAIDVLGNAFALLA